MLLLERMNIPENHWDAKLSQINDNASHKPKIQEYVDNIRTNLAKGRGLYISHKQSTGKSAIGSICLKAAASKGLVGLWLTAEKIPGYLIEDYMFDDLVSVEERIERVPLLVIDEFAFRFGTKQVRGKTVRSGNIGKREEMIESVIRRRIDANKSVIITSNIGKNGLSEMYPELYRVLTEAVDFVTTDDRFRFRPHE